MEKRVRYTSEGQSYQPLIHQTWEKMPHSLLWNSEVEGAWWKAVQDRRKAVKDRQKARICDTSLAKLVKAWKRTMDDQKPFFKACAKAAECKTKGVNYVYGWPLIGLLQPSGILITALRESHPADVSHFQNEEQCW